MAAFATSVTFAAPGDVLYSDDFQDGDLAPWTSNNAAFSGVDNLTSSTGDGGTGLSMFTFGADVTVTSPVISTDVGGVRVEAWVRKGADDFSEDPDGAENLELEYLSAGGTWELAQIFSATNIASGVVTNVVFQLPADGLHPLLQLRFHQLAGSGERGALPGWDVWHIDDVRVVETSSSLTPIPLDLGICDDFEISLGNWTITGPGRGELNTLAPSLNNTSLSLYSDTVVATSPVMDTSVGFAGVRFDIQKGGNEFSERPDNNEDLVIEYLSSANTWIELGANTYLGGNPEATFFDDQTYLAAPPANAQHAGFRLRFRLTDSSGNGVRLWDYWHIDDVCILAIDASLQVTKTVQVDEDPVNFTTNPKSIQGAYSIYTIIVNNTTNGIAANNSVVVSDVLPANVSLFVGDFDGSGSPFDFTDGASSSGISFVYSSLNNAFDDVEFLDGGGAVIGTVVPDSDGYANAVRQIRINTGGVFQPNGSFSIAFKVRID